MVIVDHLNKYWRLNLPKIEVILSTDYYWTIRRLIFIKSDSGDPIDLHQGCASRLRSSSAYADEER